MKSFNCQITTNSYREEPWTDNARIRIIDKLYPNTTYTRSTAVTSEKTIAPGCNDVTQREQESYHPGRCMVLSVIQIIGAFLSLSFNAVTLAIQEEGHRYLYTYSNERRVTWGRYWWIPSRAHYVAVGFWAAMMFIFCGAVGICAARWRTKRIIIAHHVLSVLSSLVATVLVSVTVWAIIDDSRRVARGFVYKKYWTDSQLPFKQHSSNEDDKQARRLAVVSLAFSVCWLVDGIVLITTAICSITLCVKVLCEPNNTGIGICVQCPEQSIDQSPVLILDKQGHSISGARVIHFHLTGENNDKNGDGESVSVHPGSEILIEPEALNRTRDMASSLPKQPPQYAP